LSALKIGDGAADYENPILTDLTVGNLVLLRSLDVRNCSALSKPVDISGCTNIEHVYFDGTATTGVTLPNGGILKTLHLPSTVTNLTILNQKQITDFVLPSYANISTLRIENTPNVDVVSIVPTMADNSRVRLVGFDATAESVEDIYAFFDKLDKCRGLDEKGNNTDKAVVSGTIHVGLVSSGDIANFAERYPNVTIDYEAIGNVALFLVDGVEFARQVCLVGEQIKAPTKAPTKEETAQYTFTFKGWSADGVNLVSSFGTMGEENVTFYALFDEVVRTYTIRFYNGTTLLQTQQVAYGTIPTYTGTEPTMDGKDFGGWTPELAPVTGDADYVAKFVTPSVTRGLLKRTITEYSSDAVTTVGQYAFTSCKALTSVDLPNATSIGQYAFSNCSALTSVSLPATPPSVYTDSFNKINNECVFRVPAGSLTAYQNANNWGALTSQYSFVEEDR
jgi:hypothetical protein